MHTETEIEQIGKDSIQFKNRKIMEEIIGLNRRKKFSKFSKLVDPKKQWEGFIVNLRKNNRMERIESNRKDRIKSKVWKSTGIETQDANVISMVGVMMKQMKEHNNSIKLIIQNQAEQLKMANDQIFELEMKLKSYERGYTAPKSVKISGGNLEDVQMKSKE